MKKVAIVFGGSRGIGAACVDTLARDGFAVAYTVTKAPALPPGSDDRPAVRAYTADIRDAAQVRSVYAKVSRDFASAPSCVVANAGINIPGSPIDRFDADDFRKLVDVNLVGAFNVLAEAARQITHGGSIIALTSSLVRHAVPGAGPYTATKAAVESLVRSAARELAGRQVRVNAVAPGPVNTDLFRAGKTEEMKQRFAALSPFDRVGEAAEVAEVVAFLASDRASWITGQVVQPNGGMV